jgi:NifU-like protein involved in Fe-S cluster formation
LSGGEAQAQDRPTRAGRLYTPELLGLASQLARFPLSPGDDAEPWSHRGEARSRTCGSVVELGVDLTEAGTIERLGLQVSACAVGQSSAAIMALVASGKARADIETAASAIEAWLAGDAPLPQWPGFAALEPARAHAGRHGALLAPWTALTRALSS